MKDAPLAKLHIRDEEGDVTSVALAGKADEITIGRDMENVVQLPDITISRFHARMVRSPDGDKYLIEDLESYNGVLVNGEPVRAAEVTVGDRIVVGSFMLWFEGTDGKGAFDCPTVRIESPLKK